MRSGHIVGHGLPRLAVGFSKGGFASLNLLLRHPDRIAGASIWDASLPRDRRLRTFRADRMTPRVPNGPRFAPREVPGGDLAAFLSARFKGSGGTDSWPCRGEVILDLPAADVAPFAGDGVVEDLGAGRTRLRTGSWSWAALAAALAPFRHRDRGDRPAGAACGVRGTVPSRRARRGKQ